MKFQFKGRITKAKFENKLLDLVEQKSGKDPIELIYSSPHTETDGTRVTLYYWKTRTAEKPYDTHIGSWCKGEGWIYEFDEAGIATYYDEADDAIADTHDDLVAHLEAEEGLNDEDLDALCAEDAAAERAYELRAAFGEGETVVNVITGEKYYT